MNQKKDRRVDSSNQMSFGDLIDGFDFDAGEILRPLPFKTAILARGRLVQACMEQNHKATRAVLDGIEQALKDKDTETLARLGVRGYFEGARTGSTGKVAQIKGQTSAIGALALALAYAAPNDQEAKAFAKRFAVMATRFPARIREKILPDLLTNSRDAKHPASLKQALVRACQWHPTPHNAIQHLVKARAWPKMKVPMADLTSPALTKSLLKIGADNASPVFDTLHMPILAAYVHQGGFKNPAMDLLAEAYLVQALVKGWNLSDGDITAPMKGSTKNLQEIISKQGQEDGPLHASLLEALGARIREGHLDTIKRFSSVIERASRAGQFIFLKASVGDAATLQALVDINAHRHPDEVNLATAMLGRHMSQSAGILDPVMAPAVKTLILAGANPFHNFPRLGSEPDMTLCTTQSLSEILSTQPAHPAWQDVGLMVKAQQAQKVIASSPIILTKKVRRPKAMN